MKVILVTGASRGLGLEIIKALLKDDEIKIVGISRTSNENYERLKDKFGARYTHINFNLSNSDQIKQLYLKEIKPLGPIWGFVNNAAAAYDDIITNLNINLLENMYKINVFSPMMLTKYVLRDMLLNKTKGSIVHISSISAHTGYKGLAMYASTKGALEAFSKNTAREWGGLGIRSNVVCPGFMHTDMTSTLSEDQMLRIFNRNSKKTSVSIESVASTIKFLLNESSESITGEVIHVDNGSI